MRITTTIALIIISTIAIAQCEHYEVEIDQTADYLNKTLRHATHLYNTTDDEVALVHAKYTRYFADQFKLSASQSFNYACKCLCTNGAEYVSKVEVLAKQICMYAAQMPFVNEIDDAQAYASKVIALIGNADKSLNDAMYSCD